MLRYRALHRGHSITYCLFCDSFLSTPYMNNNLLVVLSVRGVVIHFKGRAEWRAEQWAERYTHVNWHVERYTQLLSPQRLLVIIVLHRFESGTVGSVAMQNLPVYCRYILCSYL